MRVRIFLAAIVVLFLPVTQAICDPPSVELDAFQLQRLPRVKQYVSQIPETSWHSEDLFRIEARNIGSLCGEEPLPLLVKLLSDEHMKRERILRVIITLQPRGAMAYFTSLLHKGKTKEDWDTGMQFMLGTGSDEAVRELAMAAVHQKAGETRGKAKMSIHSLLESSREQVVSVLKKMVLGKFGPAEARKAGAMLLENIPGEDVDNFFLGQIANPDPNVRLSALRCMSARAYSAATGKLLKILSQDPDEKVRQQAAYNVGQGHSKASIPRLIHALKDKDVVVQRLSLRSLQQMTGRSFGFNAERWEQWWKRYDRNLAALLDMLDDEKEGNVLRALKVLGKERLNRQKISRRIAPLVRDESSRVRQAALTALGQLGEKTSVSILLRALSDDDSQTVLACLKALNRMPHERAQIAKAAKRLTDDQNDAVAAAARRLAISLAKE